MAGGNGRGGGLQEGGGRKPLRYHESSQTNDNNKTREGKNQQLKNSRNEKQQNSEKEKDVISSTK